jgi:hypothetical protein
LVGFIFILGYQWSYNIKKDQTDPVSEILNEMKKVKKIKKQETEYTQASLVQQSISFEQELHSHKHEKKKPRNCNDGEV